MRVLLIEISGANDHSMFFIRRHWFNFLYVFNSFPLIFFGFGCYFTARFIPKKIERRIVTITPGYWVKELDEMKVFEYKEATGWGSDPCNWIRGVRAPKFDVVALSMPTCPPCGRLTTCSFLTATVCCRLLHEARDGQPANMRNIWPKCLKISRSGAISERWTLRFNIWLGLTSASKVIFPSYFCITWQFTVLRELVELWWQVAVHCRPAYSDFWIVDI